MLNLSQKDLGAETDTPRTTIAGYEQGAALPSYTFLLALNTKFNANIMWLLKGEGDPFLQEKKEPPKPAILQELEKMAKEAAKETIEEQEQELIRLKVQLENLLQENEYLKQEARLAKIEDRQQALETLYEEMYDFYYNTPKDNKPRRIIQRGMGAKGIITEKTGILYPDGTFIEDAETVQEASPAYTADYKEPEEVIELPLVLSLAAGIPIEAVDINETYPVPKRLIKKNKKYCVAKIKGSSMTEAGIKDGSYV
ncbi:S24 family peptidase, partial [Treponema pedis]|uniref:helix-turn-helix domain-containing protein n=1 Tax=Treponema pedis TaxID=409322 RepID=UPI003D1E3835